MGARWASFDCYGTLIDWDGGIGRTLTELWPRESRDRLLERYHEVEPRVEVEDAIPYREVLRRSLRLLADHERLELGPDSETALADSLPSWPVFPEAPQALVDLRARGWSIAVLSNTDPDLLSASRERIGVPVDATVTAADAGSYKPAHGHWKHFFEHFEVERDRHVHVAASLFHDVRPAAELGVPALWINRVGETTDLPVAAELEDLNGLGAAADSIVPR